ncbi:glycosyltransferase family 4 protein [Candidatus Kaiserbacteria bacterium]|nr:glycosyltransferase family 4 protein [Candidatus Kaiserbacteria bacterium]
MKIGIIIEPYEEENTSGISYAIMSQASGLLKIDKTNDYILYTHKPIRSGRFQGNFKNVLVPKSFLGKNAWFFFAFLFHRKNIPDVLLFNMPLLPMVLPRSIKTIPIFYELSAYKKQGIRISIRPLVSHVYRLFEKQAVKRATHIVTASTGVRKKLIDHFHLYNEKVSTIYIGFQKFREDKGMSSQFKNQRNHFLFVGRVKYKKNVHNITDGFIQFRKENSRAVNKLFIVGLYGGTYYKNIVTKITEADLSKDVVFTGFVSDSDLYQLYKNAQGLVFCSLQEGFGMPILEAMDFGIPVITSNRSPMDEVAGDAAFIVDPENVAEIKDAMTTLVFNKRVRNELIRKGTVRAKLFSWEKHVSELFRVIMFSTVAV